MQQRVSRQGSRRVQSGRKRVYHRESKLATILFPRLYHAHEGNVYLRQLKLATILFPRLYQM
jgi:hypothetical protein